MTTLSFRAPDPDADEATRWARVLGVDRSTLLRDALHGHLTRLRSEREPALLAQSPATDDERGVDAVADWGPAEDWSDWAVVAR